jgi:hypothetical protein
MSVGAAAPLPARRELFVRHARKGGRSVAVLRALEEAGAVRVETEVFPAASGLPALPKSIPFPDARAATAFVTEAVEALMYLGCDVQAE